MLTQIRTNHLFLFSVAIVSATACTAELGAASPELASSEQQVTAGPAGVVVLTAFT